MHQDGISCTDRRVSSRYIFPVQNTEIRCRTWSATIINRCHKIKVVHFHTKAHFWCTAMHVILMFHRDRDTCVSTCKMLSFDIGQHPVSRRFWDKGTLPCAGLEMIFLPTRPGFLCTRLGLGNIVIHGGCKTILVHDDFDVLMSFSRQFPPNVSTSTYKREAVPNFSWSKTVVI